MTEKNAEASLSLITEFMMSGLFEVHTCSGVFTEFNQGQFRLEPSGLSSVHEVETVTFHAP